MKASGVGVGGGGCEAPRGIVSRKTSVFVFDIKSTLIVIFDLNKVHGTRNRTTEHKQNVLNSHKVQTLQRHM